jgi:hypothetical protein
MTKIPRFNGGLFHNIDPIALDREQIKLLIEAAKADWRYVEPAAFATPLAVAGRMWVTLGCPVKVGSMPASFATPSTPLRSSRDCRLRAPRALPVLSILALLLACVTARAAVFPPSLSLQLDGERHQLQFTGESARKFLVFRVYDIAHYAAVDGERALTAEALLADDRSKALVLEFQRDLGVERIRDEFAKSLRRNAQPGWLEAADDTIERFLGAIDRGVNDGDRLAFYWLEGGRLRVEFNGESSFAATDIAFARLLWSIWFGADPVCDREALLARLGTEPRP